MDKHKAYILIDRKKMGNVLLKMVIAYSKMGDTSMIMAIIAFNMPDNY